MCNYQPIPSNRFKLSLVPGKSFLVSEQFLDSLLDILLLDFGFLRFDNLSFAFVDSIL